MLEERLENLESLQSDSALPDVSESLKLKEQEINKLQTELRAVQDSVNALVSLCCLVLSFTNDHEYTARYKTCDYLCVSQISRFQNMILLPNFGYTVLLFTSLCHCLFKKKPDTSI